MDFLRIARQELSKYRTVQLAHGQVADAVCEGGVFTVRSGHGRLFRSTKLLLATGVRDDIPRIEGLDALYGKSVHHCPYCDAWEWRGQPIAVYGKGSAGVSPVLGLAVWTDDLVLCTDGPGDIPPESSRQLRALGIGVRRERIVRVEGRDGCLERIHFDSGDTLDRRALFFCSGQRQASDLARRLGCRFNEHGTVETVKWEATNVPGLFVCGDASKDVQFVIVAAAEGAEAAVAINHSLVEARIATL